MDFITTFFLSVMAGIVSYYICKWLDRKNSDHQPSDALPNKKRRTPSSSHYWGFILCIRVITTFLATAIIAYAVVKIKYATFYKKVIKKHEKTHG